MPPVSAVGDMKETVYDYNNVVLVLRNAKVIQETQPKERVALNSLKKREKTYK